MQRYASCSYTNFASMSDSVCLQLSLTGKTSVAHITLEWHLFLKSVCQYIARYQCLHVQSWVTHLVRLAVSTRPGHCSQTTMQQRRQTCATQTCHIQAPGKNSHLVSLDPWELLCGENAMVKTSAALNLKTVSQSDPQLDNSQTLHYVASHDIHTLKLYSGSIHRTRAIADMYH